MITTLDIADILLEHLNNSSLTTAISGEICKKRPLDSKAEDVVISTLFADNESMQSAVANVNIYAPNKIKKVGKLQDSTGPDFDRLKTLTDILTNKDTGLLIDQWKETYNFTVQQVLGPIEEEGQHYMNIRVEFKIINSLN